MPVLQIRGPSVQALKACIASELAGAPLTIDSVLDVRIGTFGSTGIALELPDGGVLTVPNSIAGYVGTHDLGAFNMCICAQ